MLDEVKVIIEEQLSSQRDLERLTESMFLIAHLTYLKPML